MADEVQKTEKDREAAKSNADLDKVTDYVEEREVDAEKFRDSMTGILDNSGGQSMESAQREKELAAVKVQSDDVKLVMDELDIDKVKAERMLKEHNGNVVNALRALVQ